MSGLRVEGVSKRYSRKAPWAVRDVSFTVEPGECVALVGESGSGKTTIANMIAGAVGPTAGSISVGEGLDVVRLSRALRGRRRLSQAVQMVFQDSFSSLDPTQRVETSIGEPIRLAGWKPADVRDRVRAVLTEVGLGGGEGQRRPRELSGGQRQRIGIARALAPRPRILLLDEPVASLDVSIQGQILTLLRDIRESEKIGMLLISHDLGVVRAIADRTLVMYRGSIVESGPTEQIFARPAHPYTQGLLWAATAERAATMPPDAREALANESRPVDPDSTACVFRDRCWRRIEACDHAVTTTITEDRMWSCNVPLVEEGVSA